MPKDNPEEYKSPSERKMPPIKRWLMEISMAKKQNDGYIREGNRILKLYQPKKPGGANAAKKYNILWSNTETKRPALYSNTPNPDVRRRFPDESRMSKAVAEIIERSLSATVDLQDFDNNMSMDVLDMLLPGRGWSRVRYEPVTKMQQNPNFDELIGESDDNQQEVEVLVDEKVIFDHVQWDDLLFGPAKTWEDLPWLGMRHTVTKKDAADMLPDAAEIIKELKPDFSPDGLGDEKKNDDRDELRYVVIWEIWDKETEQVLFIAPSYKKDFLKKEPVPQNLVGFFPGPRPLRAIDNNESNVPTAEYLQYEDQAKELNLVTARINRITSILKVRGIYDATIGEIQSLQNVGDGTLVPSKNINSLIRNGGLERAIWMMPLTEASQVIAQLYVQREQVKQVIFEITGISDVARGSTNPNETLGAQKLKANFGGQRLSQQRREVQRYARDLMRIAAEIIAENFQIETLQRMTQLNYPTAEEKESGSMLNQLSGLASQIGLPIPETFMRVFKRMAAFYEEPSWEEIKEVMGSDELRQYSIDIETDSTIQPDAAEEQKNFVDLLSAITNYFAGIAPVVQSGAMTMDAAKQLLLAGVRRFKLGRSVEDAIDSIGQTEGGEDGQGQPPQGQDQPAEGSAPPDPIKAQEAIAKAQIEQQRLQLDNKKLDADIQIRQQELALEREKMEVDKIVAQANLIKAQQPNGV